MQHARRVGAAILLLFLCQIGFSQQLRLGNNPYTVEKSAVLELQSTNQGLLFPRIADTLLINVLLPPDGMVIYFTTTKQLLLRINGSWQPLTKGSAISSLNGLTATVQTFAIGTAGTDVNIISSGTAHTFNIPDASATARGLITTGAQTLAGSKTLTAAPIFSSLTQGSIPFIGSGGVVSQNNNNLFWDAANSRLGIGTTTPSTKLHVTGTNPLTLTGVQLGTNTSADSLLTITNGLVRKLPVSTFATPITTGNLTETGSSILTITGGTGAVVGSGTTLQVKQASASQNGFLSSADWTTFNNKLSTVDTTNIASFSVKVRSLFGAATGIGYNAATGIFTNTGVTSVNGNTGALTMDTTYISNFATKTRSLFSAGTGIIYNAATGVISATTASVDWQLLGNAGTVPANHFIGTTDAQPFITRTNNIERMRVDALGHVGIGVTNPANPLVVKDTLEIRRTGTMSELLFSNTSGTGDFRIGGDGGDIFWQGGGGRTLQMGSYWGMVLAGDRQTGTFPAFVNGIGNTNVIIPAQRDASVPLGVQANSATQTANLTEWRNSSATALSVVDRLGRFGIGVTAVNNTLEVGGTVAGTGVSGLRLTSLGAATAGAANSKVLSVNSNGDVIVTNYPTGGTAWSLTGNSGTVPATNFLGTTDNQPLIIKTNNTQMGRFDVNSLALGIGATVNNATHSFAFGNNALTAFSVTGALAMGTSAAVNGSNSFAIGTGAVTNGTTSFSLGNAATVAFGVTDAMALGTNATANGNNGIAIGSNTNTAAKTTVNGVNGVAIGTGATANGGNSIAMGNTALVGYVASPSIGIGNAATINGANSTGIGTSATIGSVTNATAIGANTSVTGSNSSAIGYNTAVTGSDAIILGDMTNSNLSVGIGSEAFTSGAREKLLVDAGSVSGSYNVISGKGTVNNYLQLNIQNKSNGNTASSDLVATADNGSEAGNYVDLGINSSGFTNTTYPIIGGINNAYLYSTGNDFVIGNATANKNLLLFTGGYAAANERMRIDGTGNVGVATTAPTAKLDVGGTYKLGAKGSVNKNSISFLYTVPSNITIPAGASAGTGSVAILLLGTYPINTTNTFSAGTFDMNVAVIAANQPTSTQATVSVSPAFDLPANVAIASARVSSTSQVRIRFLNNGTGTQTITSGQQFYITITEF